MTFAAQALRSRRAHNPTRTTDLAGIGARFGLYRALSSGPVTGRQLARITYTDINFVKEWLEQQVYEGYVTYDASTGRYTNYCTLPQVN